MNIKALYSFFALVFLVDTTVVQAQPTEKLVVQANNLKAEVQPTMWGVFFEDINMGADGGIYAELIKNRSFEFFKPMMGWKVLGKPETEGDFQVLNRQKWDTANPRYLQITLHQNVKGTLGLKNEGFRGIGVKEGAYYDFSVMYRQESSAVSMHIELVNEKNEAIGVASINSTKTGEWKKATGTIKATGSAEKGSFQIWFEGNGILNLDMVSLFPKDTWKGRPGGMRKDMIQLLADMKPGFLRFPGGCIVEGFDLSQRYQWKKTIGPVDQRQLIINRWNFEFAHRPAPDYFQTFGLGFFEYFQLSEDIGAEPLPILNAGMACQFNSGELVQLNDLDPYVQDALDLIEFANGDSTTVWGKIRSSMGHPKPFNMKMLGVGNENWGPQYLQRLRIFIKAIKEKYPQIKLVNSSGTDPDGSRFDYLNGELRKSNADLIDEHFYRRPEWFLGQAARYDNYPRTGSKVFAGEYAAQSDKTVSTRNQNNWQTALAEAAFMTGMERNADVVYMASYAPLFAHVEGWQWTPNMIWLNNNFIHTTPNYEVQKLFSLNKGTHVVPLLQKGQPLAGADSLYASAVIDQNTGELVVKIVNASAAPQQKGVLVQGVKKLGPTATLFQLKGAGLHTTNSFNHSINISPQKMELKVKGTTIVMDLQPYSFNVLRVKKY